MRAASMLTDPKSFTRTAARIPARPARIRFTSVVFPAPRNPPTTVSGMRPGADAASGMGGLEHLAAEDRAPHARILEPLRRERARIVVEHAEIGALADLDGADLVVHPERVRRSQRDRRERL